MNQQKIHLSILPILIVLLISTHIGAKQGGKTLFRIGTGGNSGVYYPIGKLIAKGLTDTTRQGTSSGDAPAGVPGCIAVAQNSAGSVANIRTIVSGETEAGLVQADVASMAYHTTGIFTGRPEYKKLRAIASLYPEKFHIVVRKDSGITIMDDLKGKRISLDEPGSGTLSVMRIILAQSNLSEKQMAPVYLKPVFTKDKMITGEIQGFVMMAGTPLKAVLNLSQIGITLVPIPQKTALKINKKHPYLVPGMIKANVYPGVEKTPTLQVHALLAVSADLDTNKVYQVTRELWNIRTQRLLKQGHPQGKSILLKTALKGLSIPLHDGAGQFYRVKGMDIQ